LIKMILNNLKIELGHQAFRIVSFNETM
jgi:hypothetical protein